MIEPSYPLHDELLASVELHLDELLAATGVRYCMLVDRKGFMLVHKEALWAPKPPALDSIATLVASNAAATEELASMLGESTFTEQIHQGVKGVLYVESVGKSALLTLIFDMTVPPGRVKVYAKKTIILIATILDSLAALPAPKLNPGFADSAGALLDDLLG